MKTAKIFLAGMYLHLVLSVATPIGILALCLESGWNAAGLGLLAFYLLMIVLVQIWGWITVSRAVAAYRRGRSAALWQGWRLLKLGSIPFYILNFLWSCLVWFILVGASRGILFLLVPIPVCITGLMVVQTGCVGACCLKILRSQAEGTRRVHGIHYLLQLLPVLDVISTLVVLKRYPQPKE